MWYLNSFQLSSSVPGTQPPTPGPAAFTGHRSHSLGLPLCGLSVRTVVVGAGSSPSSLAQYNLMITTQSPEGQRSLHSERVGSGLTPKKLRPSAQPGGSQRHPGVRNLLPGSHPGVPSIPAGHPRTPRAPRPVGSPKHFWARYSPTSDPQPAQQGTEMALETLGSQRKSPHGGSTLCGAHGDCAGVTALRKLGRALGVTG